MTTTAPPVLVLCAHGTDDPDGAATVHGLRDLAAAARPDLDVRVAYVDVQLPRVRRVVEEVVGSGRQVVVVPLLLSLGFHIEVDVAGAVGPFAGAVATGSLGPDPVLAEVLLDRLREAGAEPGDAVVMAAAGSSRAGAARDALSVADALAHRWQGPVRVGFGSKATPSVSDAVDAAREAQTTQAGGGRVVVAAYLVGRGFFHSRLSAAGADLVTAPLGADPRLADLALRRYALGVGRLLAADVEEVAAG